MWDTAGFPLKPIAGPVHPHGYRALRTQRRASPNKIGERHSFASTGVIPTRISYFALLATTTCAALRKESRMQIINTTGLDRKSGGPTGGICSPRLGNRPSRRARPHLTPAIKQNEYLLEVSAMNRRPVCLDQGVHFMLSPEWSELMLRGCGSFVCGERDECCRLGAFRSVSLTNGRYFQEATGCSAVSVSMDRE